MCKQDEKEIQKTAVKQYRVLRSATSFRYGYKLVVRLYNPKIKYILLVLLERGASFSLSV